MTITSRALASETINGLRRSSYPPLWRALRDPVEGAPLDDEHLDLVREVARKAESVAVWDDERILALELGVAQWLTGDALVACGHEPVGTPADARTAHLAAGELSMRGFAARRHRMSADPIQRADDSLFYGSGVKGAMELIFQYPSDRPSDPIHSALVEVARSISPDLVRGDREALVALRGGFLRALRDAL